MPERQNLETSATGLVRTEPDGELDRILDLLGRYHVVTLACRDDQGTWAAAVFFAHDGLNLYFMSSAQSRHVRCLEFDPYLAGVIQGPAHDWQSIVGLQVLGKTEQVPLEGVAAAWKIYAQRFPFADEPGGKADPALAKALKKASWFRLSICEAVILDNTRGFANRVHWKRPAG